MPQSRSSAYLLLFASLTLSLSYAAFIGPNNPHLRYSGRVEKVNNYVEYDWPCVSIEANLTGTAIYVVMDGGHNIFQVTVDGKQSRLATLDGEEMYELAYKLENKPHHVVIQKMTEASYFIFKPLLPLSKVKFKGFYAEHALPLSGAPKSRKIEIIGDSNSNGFGIDGPNHMTCMLSFPEYENCMQSYGAVLANQLQAEYHIEAWTGMGVVKNAVDIFPESSAPMLAYLNRSVATDEKSRWRFHQWTPDLVLVMLGCNDYLSWPTPTETEFVDGYVKLLHSLFASYNVTPATSATKAPVIINLCGGHSGNNRAPCKNIEAAVMDMRRAGFNRCFYVEIAPDWLDYPKDFGCLDHRNVEGQAKLAAHLLPKIKEFVGW